MLKRSLETRWFFETCPSSSEQFLGGVHEPTVRIDWYAFPCDRGCGIKLREGRLETKLLVEDFGSQRFDFVDGNVESWHKWSVAIVDEAILTQKREIESWLEEV